MLSHISLANWDDPVLCHKTLEDELGYVSLLCSEMFCLSITSGLEKSLGVRVGLCIREKCPCSNTLAMLSCCSQKPGGKCGLDVTILMALKAWLMDVVSHLCTL